MYQSPNLHRSQIAQFKTDLAKALPEAQVFSTICKDSSGAEPTYENGFNAKCDGKGDTTIVKVLWLQDVEEENAQKISTHRGITLSIPTNHA